VLSLAGMFYNLNKYIEQLKVDIDDSTEEARKKLLDKVIEDTDEFVPYKTGKLSKNVVANTTTNEVIYQEEYASYAFNPIAPSGVPKQYNHEVHPNAQGYPMQKSIAEHEEDWLELFRKEVENELQRKR
jgi:hypothetical protein